MKAKTNEEKVKPLMELVPGLSYHAAITWFPFRDYDDYGDPFRLQIVTAVRDIEAGVVGTPLWEALK